MCGSTVPTASQSNKKSFIDFVEKSMQKKKVSMPRAINAKYKSSNKHKTAPKRGL
jgi:hypothetical protein